MAGCGVCVVPVFGWGPPLHIVPVPLCPFMSLYVAFVSFLFVCCRVRCGWGSAVVSIAAYALSHSVMCGIAL